MATISRLCSSPSRSQGWWLLVGLIGGLGCPVAARAERGLVAPNQDQPAVVAPGGLLVLQVEVATGLTPPPGIQEERAHRAFGLGLCVEGIDLGAGARRCFPLAIQNVRPLDAVSLRYRVEARVPRWLAPSRYDLAVRFPGGRSEAKGALWVGAAQAAHATASVSGADPFVFEAGAEARTVRLHVAGSSGIEVRQGAFAAFPLPDPVAGFAPGFVALIQVPAHGRVFVTKRQASARFGLTIAAGRAEAGRSVTLRAVGAPPGSQVFWWLGAGQAGLGTPLTTRFLYPGKLSLQALAVAPDGRVSRAESILPIWQRRAFGCSLGRGAATIWDPWCCVGLLVLSRSWKLRAASRRRRRGVC